MGTPLLYSSPGGTDMAILTCSSCKEDLDNKLEHGGCATCGETFHLTKKCATHTCKKAAKTSA